MLAAGRLARLRRVAGVQRWRRDWIGLDVGGERSATAVVWVNEHLPVGAAICHGDPGVLEPVDPRPRSRRPLQRPASWSPTPGGSGRPPGSSSPKGASCRLPQHDARMIPASAALHAAIVERRLTLRADSRTRLAVERAQFKPERLVLHGRL
jgi:hypothetical protein